MVRYAQTFGHPTLIFCTTVFDYQRRDVNHRKNDIIIQKGQPYATEIVIRFEQRFVAPALACGPNLCLAATEPAIFCLCS